MAKVAQTVTDRVFNYLGEGRGVLLPLDEVAKHLPKCKTCGNCLKLLSSQRKMHHVVIFCETCTARTMSTARR